jgi:hypothetical protein
MGENGIRLLMDALVGNTNMDVLGLVQNHIMSTGLDDITRLLKLTRIKED